MFQSFPKPEEQKLFSWKRSFCRRSFNLAAVSMAVPTFAASPIWPILWKRKARWMTTELSEARRYQGCAGRIISKPGIREPLIANSPTPPSECLGSSVFSLQKVSIWLNPAALLCILQSTSTLYPCTFREVSIGWWSFETVQTHQSWPDTDRSIYCYSND